MYFQLLTKAADKWLQELFPVERKKAENKLCNNTGDYESKYQLTYYELQNSINTR